MARRVVLGDDAAEDEALTDLVRRLRARQLGLPRAAGPPRFAG
jgi:hypothetical protein